MLPLRRPDLFNGGLLKPCRGILLFGPPGTGKTMLAKAIAREAGASFINVSMSTITSKWFGEDEKNVRALFTLAAKVSPTIIFVDEVDSMLGQRTRVGEHEAMRKIKNEFMTHWDGLLTRPGERILVLAATNRPFDLDEAIIRRFERRYDKCIAGDISSHMSSYLAASVQLFLYLIALTSTFDFGKQNYGRAAIC